MGQNRLAQVLTNRQTPPRDPKLRNRRNTQDAANTELRLMDYAMQMMHGNPAEDEGYPPLTDTAGELWDQAQELTTTEERQLMLEHLYKMMGKGNPLDYLRQGAERDQADQENTKYIKIPKRDQ